MRTERGPAGRGRFLRAAGGSVAVEFALVVPLLTTLYLGSVDLTMGFTCYRKFTHATSVMGDLVNRTNSVSKSDLQGIIEIGDGVLAPRASALDSSKISAISVDGSGKAKVVWSFGKPEANKDGVGAVVALPAELKSLKNVEFVRTVASYTYRPPMASQVVGDIRWEKEIYGQTRTGTKVSCTDC